MFVLQVGLSLELLRLRNKLLRRRRTKKLDGWDRLTEARYTVRKSRLLIGAVAASPKTDQYKKLLTPFK